MMNKYDIFQRLQEHQEVLMNFGVRRCGLFGSFRRGEATEDSDIDLLVTFEPELKTFMNFMDLCFFLEDLFELLTQMSIYNFEMHSFLGRSKQQKDCLVGSNEFEEILG